MSKPSYRIGVIGHTGRGNYGHGLDLAWADVERAQVVAVADPHEAGRTAAQKQTGAKTAYADYREMLAQERLDIVTVAPRWIDQHRDMVVAAAEHGCHVYMEKPFCRTLQEADEIVRALEMRHLKLQIAHANRFSPVLGVVQQLLRQGEIGDVLEVRARGKEDSLRGGGEDLWVLGTHMLDLMRALFGDVRSCFASVTANGKPVQQRDVSEGNEGIGPLAGDRINAVYEFQSGIAGYFASHRGAGGTPSRFGLQVFGTRGIIEMTSGYLNPAWLLKDPAWSPGRTGAKWVPVTSAGVGRPEPLADAAGHHGANTAAAKDLIAAIEADRPPASSAYDARAATEMIVAVFESHRVGRPVAFPLENRRNPLTMLG